MKLLPFFEKAHNYVIAQGYQWEIELVENRYFKDVTQSSFKWAFLFCCLGSSGLNNRVVEKQMNNFTTLYEAGENAFDSIPNGNIRRAVIRVWSNHINILDVLKSKMNDIERIDFIRTLPQMGKKSGKHFARNMGIDCVKPDIWMERLAEKYVCWNLVDGYVDPDRMCLNIQKQLPVGNIPYYRIGTIDVILWRYCNLTGELE